MLDKYVLNGVKYFWEMFMLLEDQYRLWIEKPTCKLNMEFNWCDLEMSGNFISNIQFPPCLEILPKNTTF